MTLTQEIIIILLLMIATIITRFLPFLIFPAGKTPPVFIQYLGTVLPYASMGLLLVFCLKEAVFSSYRGIFELVAIVFICILHKWKRNTLLSIGGGTVFYMVLVQTLMK